MQIYLGYFYNNIGTLNDILDYVRLLFTIADMGILDKYLRVTLCCE
jgi:hypothetical protein